MEPGLDFYLQAFFTLDSERNAGEMLTLIPWSSIMHFADRCELDDDDTDELLSIVRKLDVFHINRLHAKRKRDEPKPAKRGKLQNR